MITGLTLVQRFPTIRRNRRLGPVIAESFPLLQVRSCRSRHVRSYAGGRSAEQCHELFLDTQARIIQVWHLWITRVNEVSPPGLSHGLEAGTGVAGNRRLGRQWQNISDR